MKSKPNPFLLHLLAATLGLASPVFALDGTWTADTTPLLWSGTGNWATGTVADGSGFTAYFTNNITGDRVVNIDADKTITNIVFGDSDPSSAGSWTIGNNGVSSNNLILAGTTPTITVNALGTAKTATISAIIEGSAGLTKAGVGTLILSGTNTYTGETNISEGKFQVASNVIANSATIKIGNGATLESTGGFTLASGQSVTGTGTTGFVNTTASTGLGMVGNNTLSTSGTLTLTRLGVLGSGNQISGGSIQSGSTSARGLVVGSGGTGTLTIAGGSLTTNGVITGSFFDILGNGAGNSGTLIINSGGSYANNAAGKLSLGNTNASGTLTINNGGSATISELEFNAAASGGSAIVNLNSGGTLTLSKLTVTAGATKQFNFDGGQFIAGSGFTTGSGLTLNVKNGGAKIDTNGNSYTISDALLRFTGATTDSLTKSGDGTLTLSSASSTYGGGTYINFGILSLGASSIPTSGFVTSGPLGTGSVYLGGGTLKTSGFTLANDIIAVASTSSIIDSTGNATLNGNLSGSGTITKSSANQLVLGGSNASFQGTFTETGTGPLSFLTSNSGSASAKWVQAAASTWVASANGITVKLGELSSTVTTGTVRPGSAVSAGNQVTFEVGALGTDATYSGKITDYVSSGTRTANVTKVGSGNWTLSNTNTYTGETRVSDGKLTLGHATNTLADTSAVNVNGGELALGTNTDTVGAVTLTSGSITGSGAGKLTGTGSNFDVRSGTISAKLGGSVGLDKTTGGTVTISSDNSSGGYTGNTTVTAGMLVVNGNISTSTLTTVSGTGKLGGSGTVGALTIDNGGTLAPGTSPGTISVIGDLGLNNSSILDFELNPVDTTTGSNINDLVAITGGLTLDGLLRVTATSGNFLAATNGTKWTLFTYSGSLLANNTLSFDTGFMPALDSGLEWSIDTATTGQVNLVVIPEPRAAVLGLIGTLALLRRRRS